MKYVSNIRVLCAQHTQICICALLSSTPIGHPIISPNNPLAVNADYWEIWQPHLTRHLPSSLHFTLHTSRASTSNFTSAVTHSIHPTTHLPHSPVLSPPAPSSHDIAMWLQPPAPQQAPLYAVFLLIPLLGGLLSFAASDNTPCGVAWRKSLVKSSLSPGSITTAVLWVLLYFCMGHASFCVYTQTQTSVLTPSFIAYLTQLLLNHFYIIVLFGLQRIDLAMFMMVPLWCATAVTTGLFYEASVEAGKLMLPVWAWVSFSAYLNTVLYRSNRIYTELELSYSSDKKEEEMSKQKAL